MNQKSWALISVAFIAGIMILSSLGPLADLVMRGGTPVQETSPEVWSLRNFGVEGRLINWDFEGVEDALGMYPENLVFAYWINTTASDNLTTAASKVLPPSAGMMYGDFLYQSKVERVSWGLFGDRWAEFHWIKPYPLGYYGLALNYNGYQMIPSSISSDLFNVMGMPTLFGNETAMKMVLDVISGVEPTTYRFALPYDQRDDLQVSCLGKTAVVNPDLDPPLGGEYQELYLGVSQLDEGFLLTAKYLAPEGNTQQKVRDVADKYGLKVTSGEETIEITGSVDPQSLEETLGELLSP